MPLTDLAAGFLFREGLGHLDPNSAVTVVDYAADADDKRLKLGALLAAYQRVFPGMRGDRIDFSGGAAWVRDTGADWLYDSSGDPVAFRAMNHAYFRSGSFIGTIRDYYPPRRDIWNGAYRAEIFDGNRLVRALQPPTENRGPANSPGPIGVPTVPANIGAIALPSDLVDVDRSGV
jgi:hypothetical protein